MIWKLFSIVLSILHCTTGFCLESNCKSWSLFFLAEKPKKYKRNGSWRKTIRAWLSMFHKGCWRWAWFIYWITIREKWIHIIIYYPGTISKCNRIKVQVINRRMERSAIVRKLFRSTLWWMGYNNVFHYLAKDR